MKKHCWASFLLSATVTAHAEQFSLSSPEIKPSATIKNEQVFSGFGCTGGNVSPTLEWKIRPKGAKSFALLVDPDAPLVVPAGGTGC